MVSDFLKKKIVIVISIIVLFSFVISCGGGVSGAYIAGGEKEVPDVEPEKTSTASQENGSSLQISSETQSALKGKTIVAYFNENSAASNNLTEDQMILAVQATNRILLQNGFKVVDYNRIKKLTDEMKLTQEELQGGLSLVDALSNDINADIFIEVSGNVEAPTMEAERYDAKGNITLSIFDAITAEQYGVDTMYSRGLSDSEDQAIKRVIEDGIAKALPSVLGMATPRLKEGSRIMIMAVSAWDPEQLTQFYKYVQNFTGVNESRIVRQSEESITVGIAYSKAPDSFSSDFLDYLQNSEDVDLFETLIVAQQSGNRITYQF